MGAVAMGRSIRAIFSDGLLRPLESLDLQEGDVVAVSIEDPPPPSFNEEIDVERRGQALYEEKIRSRVEATERGKFVVIDVGSGDYEIDSDDAAATVRLMARSPGAVTYAVRVGHAAAYRMSPRFSFGHHD